MAVLRGCGAAIALLVIWPTAALCGQPRAQATIQATTPAAVKEKAIARCVRNGATIVDTSNTVQCRFKVEGGRGVMAQMLLGNAYSTPPEHVVQFTMADLSGSTLLLAQQWIETQMPGGQVQRADLNAKKHVVEAQSFVDAIAQDVAGDADAAIEKEKAPQMTAAPSTQGE